MKKFEVKIRYNTEHLKNKNLPKWRVLIEKVEYKVDEVEIFSKSYTTMDVVKVNNGEILEKYHLSTKAKSFNLLTIKGVTKAILR